MWQAVTPPMVSSIISHLDWAQYLRFVWGHNHAVEDVGRVLKDLAGKNARHCCKLYLTNGCVIVAKVENHKDIKGIYHFSGEESITKYQVCGKVEASVMVDIEFTIVNRNRR